MCNGPVRYTSYYPPRTLINEISGNLIPLTAQRFTVVTFHRMQFVGGRPIGTTLSCPKKKVLPGLCNRITEGEVVAHALEIYIDASCRRLPDFETQEVIWLFQSARKKG